MSSPLDDFQQVFCLSLIMCSASKNSGTAEVLREDIRSNIQALFQNPAFGGEGGWSIAWGPVVWQAQNSQVVDQAISICYNSRTNTYVVPIAATNPNSNYDKFDEDWKVAADAMVPFPGGGAGSISEGNADGLQNLLTMQSNGESVGAFLTKHVDSTATVVISGHSLGGGLSPLLAYALFPKGTSASGWGHVYTYPTAGPSTADQHFVAAFDAAFPATGGTGHQQWNTNLYNVWDIVPNVWSGTGAAPGIAQITASSEEGTDAMFYTSLELVVNRLRAFLTKKVSGTSGNPYASTNSYALFYGPREHGLITLPLPLWKEALYQHTTAYVNALGVSGLFPGKQVESMIQPPLIAMLPAMIEAGEAAAAMPDSSAAEEAETAL